MNLKISKGTLPQKRKIAQLGIEQLCTPMSSITKFPLNMQCKIFCVFDGLSQNWNEKFIDDIFQQAGHTVRKCFPQVYTMEILVPVISEMGGMFYDSYPLWVFSS